MRKLTKLDILGFILIATTCALAGWGMWYFSQTDMHPAAKNLTLFYFGFAIAFVLVLGFHFLNIDILDRSLKFFKKLFGRN